MINVSKLYCGLAGTSDKLRYSSQNNFGPVVVFNCTPKCNLRCAHCYSSSHEKLEDKTLDTTQAKKLLNDLTDANCPVVLFSGGEPLLRHDLFELLAEAKSLKLKTVISTNGTLIDETVANKLADLQTGYVGISLDGTREIHDRFRGVDGAFDKTLAGIENCRKADLRTGLRFTINKKNANQIENIFHIASENGVRRICFYHLIQTGRAKNLQNDAPTAEQTRNVVDMIIDKTAEFTAKGLIDEVLTVGNHADGPYLLWRMKKEGNGAYEKAKELLKINGGNKIGEQIACVNWDGEVYADQFWRNYSLGNVTSSSFKDIWYAPDEPVLKKLRDKENWASEKCIRCKWFELCKGNYRFTSEDSSDLNWYNEPACYLTDEQMRGN